MVKVKITSILILIFIFLITILFGIKFAFSKYKNTSLNETSVKVAVMASDIELDVLTPIDMYPGCDPTVVAIILSNEKNGRVCEVAQSYSISIKREDIINIPFEFSLYKDAECTEALTLTADGSYHDPSFQFAAGVKSEKTYYLKIEWPEQYNDPSYAFEIDYFKVYVETVQIN